MKNRNHITEKVLDKAIQKISKLRSSLLGLGGLFTQGTINVSLDDDEFHGIGILLKKLSTELSIVEEILNCGLVSTADERSGLYNDDEDEKIKR